MAARSYDHFPASHVHIPDVFPGVDFLLRPVGNRWSVSVVGTVMVDGERRKLNEHFDYTNHEPGPLGRLIGSAIRGDVAACTALAEQLMALRADIRKDTDEPH